MRGADVRTVYLMNYLYEPWLRALNTNTSDRDVALIIQAFANRQVRRAPGSAPSALIVRGAAPRAPRKRDHREQQPVR
jgi:hypothetical protein